MWLCPQLKHVYNVHIARDPLIRLALRTTCKTLRVWIKPDEAFDYLLGLLSGRHVARMHFSIETQDVVKKIVNDMLKIPDPRMDPYQPRVRIRRYPPEATYVALSLEFRHAYEVNVGRYWPEYLLGQVTFGVIDGIIGTHLKGYEPHEISNVLCELVWNSVYDWGFMWDGVRKYLIMQRLRHE